MLMDCRTWLTRRRARPSRRHPPAADEATPRPSHDHASRRRPSVANAHGTSAATRCASPVPTLQRRS